MYATCVQRGGKLARVMAGFMFVVGFIAYVVALFGFGLALTNFADEEGRLWAGAPVVALAVLAGVAWYQMNNDPDVSDNTEAYVVGLMLTAVVTLLLAAVAT